MSGYEVVEEVKKRSGISSDSAMSRMLNKERQYVSNLKKRGGDPEANALLDLMIAGNLTAIEAKELLSKKSQLGQKGFASLSLLIVTAVFMSLISLYISGYGATLYTLCEVKRHLQRFTGKAVFNRYFVACT